MSWLQDPTLPSSSTSPKVAPEACRPPSLLPYFHILYSVFCPKIHLESIYSVFFHHHHLAKSPSLPGGRLALTASLFPFLSTVGRSFLKQCRGCLWVHTLEQKGCALSWPGGIHCPLLPIPALIPSLHTSLLPCWDQGHEDAAHGMAVAQTSSVNEKLAYVPSTLILCHFSHLLCAVESVTTLAASWVFSYTFITAVGIYYSIFVF